MYVQFDFGCFHCVTDTQTDRSMFAWTARPQYYSCTFPMLKMYIDKHLVHNTVYSIILTVLFTYVKINCDKMKEGQCVDRRHL